MTTSTRSQPREQTTGEEIANSESYGIGFLLALGVLPVIVQSAMQRGRAAEVVAASLFASTMNVL